MRRFAPALVALALVTATGCAGGLGDVLDTVERPISTAPITRPTTPESTSWPTSTTRAPRPTTTTTTTTTVPAPETFGVAIEWQTDLGSDDPALVAVRDGLAAALSTGLDGPDDLHVFAFRDVDRLDDAYSFVYGEEPDRTRWEVFDGRGGVVFHDGEPTYVMFMHVGTVDGDADRVDLMAVMAHEWFHVYQYSVVPPTARTEWASGEPGAAAPAWFAEGSATWFEYHALDAVGLDLEQWYTGPRWRLDHPSGFGFPGLAAWETQDDFYDDVGDDSYGYAAGAVDLLAELTSPDMVLRSYWTGRAGYDGAWQDVFEFAFGLTAEQFYADVDRYVADAVFG